MERQGTVMIPYLGSAGWYARHVGELLGLPSGLPPEGMDPARLLRTVIMSATGERLLSVPVAGGAHAFRRHATMDAPLSEHGDWRRVHLGAINAEYGRTPCFAHLYPAIERALDARHTTLRQVSEPLHSMVMSMLLPQRGCPEAMAALREEWLRRSGFFMEMARETEPHVCPDVSVLDLLMRHGAATLPLLLALGNN